MGFRIAKLTTLIAAVAFLTLAERPVATAVSASTDSAQRRRAKAPRIAPAVFTHQTAAHRKSCSACHTFPSKAWAKARVSEDAFPDVVEFPEHSSCLECHRSDFFARQRPAPRICSVCHVGVTPKFTDRLPFPSPAKKFWATAKALGFTSEFSIHFPHATHLEALGADPAKPSAVCSTCHETYQPQGDSADEYAVPPPSDLGDGFWLKKGTFKTSPRDHAACFSCHAADSGLDPAPSNCSACHVAPVRQVFGFDFDAKAAPVVAVTDPLTRHMWSRRGSAANFRHEGGLHTDVACTTCHDTSAIATEDAATRRVPVQSCGGTMGCHITATTDEGGALTFEAQQRADDPAFRCTKCHLAYGRIAMPAAHKAAIDAAKGA